MYFHVCVNIAVYALYLPDIQLSIQLDINTTSHKYINTHSHTYL